MPNPTSRVMLLVGVLLGTSSMVTVAADSVSADHGVAAGGDIRDSIITIGYTPEQVEMLIQASNKDLRTAYESQVKELSNRLGVTQDAVANFFQILREKNVPLEKLPETLVTIAQLYLEMEGRLAIHNPEDPAAKALIEKARMELNTDHYDRTDTFLSRAEIAELNAARQAERLARNAQAAADRCWLNAATTRAARGELSMFRLNHEKAAKHYQVASEMVPDSAPTERGIFRGRWADALVSHNLWKSNNAALRQAITLYRQALADLPRDRAPQEWATIQNNLGLALQTLGEREANTTRLEEAIDAFRAALEVRTRERVPLEWAGTQNNLGITLQTLGAREAGTARLEEAVAAFRAALEVCTRDRAPLEWASIQDNLGISLATLGDREVGTARLKEAIAAHRAALEVRTRNRAPLDRARTQHNLGAALAALGKREAGTARLEEAVAAIRAALEVRTRIWVPLSWARTQAGLGLVLATLGERETSTAHLEKAITAFRAALEGTSKNLGFLVD
ncbi:MAG: tetratricopeptide repeat protein [Gammaproteobacteria bacterium]|nr:tetratricopeptide repeat protein [Gammaproteobacteria bacterium]